MPYYWGLLISAQNYKISLMNRLILISRMLFDVQISEAGKRA
ncbi:hypothetical protein RUMGNA_00533 [Mediterraneibacter gnavus ATCC 29149]|uniref:Uncharacterized protein n=1 Tax=Mediterraneibacter gnavus (strain ATCC 29149 / DSM 114966 / JCM 6515 / VPI C7-9) TaxID=411470 RepID=A7AZ18_MEDG7|nr:hypothetical protein RUMGNA_00533 [Mediterraneibacter gnavus ATCC 29149]